MQDLVKKLSELLLESGMTVTTAESCTGGLLSATITHRAGASQIFDRGFITYSNEAKMDMLDVPVETLEEHGAVSAETAKSMVEGALKNSNADIAVSITGIAGPDGGSADKPVGLVYLGYALRGGSAGSVKEIFEGEREAVQTRSVITALKHLIAVLEQS